ncbi:MAG: hypothetical protein L0Y71_19135 [Gemmataceae bacterium]|nr:hypothetical protein [Gemmataceae bacterium]
MNKFTVTDPTDVVTIRTEQAKNPSNMGVGVVDAASGAIRVYPYDQTDEWVSLHPQCMAMAGHEAAAWMAGFPIPSTRGFVLDYDSAMGQWRVVNRSHLNFPDGGMRMESQSFDRVLEALADVGILNPTIIP